MRQRIVSSRVHTNDMTKLIISMVAIAALAGAAGIFYWAHQMEPTARASKASATAAVSAATINRDAAGSSSAPVSLSRPAEPTERPAPAEPASPLRAGEVLEFAADVAKLSNVANLRLQIVERRNFFGKNAWHLQAFARTENPLRMMFELDDQFDSYSDVATLWSLQYEMHLNERGEKEESIQRMSTSGTERAAPNATQTRVVPGTRDPLGLMQYLRTVDWSKTREVNGPVYDGHKLYDVRASYAGGAETVTVPAGTFATSKVNLRVFDAGVEMKDAQFTLYLANNVTRPPVLLEAVLPFATAHVALVKIK